MADDWTRTYPIGAEFSIYVNDRTNQFDSILTRAASASNTEYADAGIATAITVKNVQKVNPWSYVISTSGRFRFTGAASNWKLRITADTTLTNASQAFHGNQFSIGLNGSSLTNASTVATQDLCNAESDASINPSCYKMELTYMGPVADGDDFTIFQDCGNATAVYDITNLRLFANPW